MKASARSRTRSSPERAFIGLGTNEGARLQNLLEARRRLARLGTVTAGPIVETEALLPPDDPTPQPPYLNSVVELATRLSAPDLHRALKRLERQLGRRLTTRWAPRIIDLDLLLYGDAVIETPELTVPHPRMHERRFVLEPLRALAPALVHPKLGRTIAELARTALPRRGVKSRRSDP